MVVQIVNTTLSRGVLRTIGTMPSDLCPSKVVYGTLHYSQYAGSMRVDMNGVVSAIAPYGGDYTGQVVYTI